MWNKLNVIYNLLLLGVFTELSIGVNAEIFPCFNNGTRKGDVLLFPEYSEMTICCQLQEADCSRTTLNDTLLLKPKQEIDCSASCIEENMYRQEKCLVRYKVNNATLIDDGDYICVLKGHTLLQESVYIIEKPVLPSIISFSCYQYVDVNFDSNFNLTVQFDRYTRSTKYNDSYEVAMVLPTSEKIVLCNTSRPVCNGNERICICKISNIKGLTATVTVTIIVKTLRAIQFSEVRRNYTIASVIRPLPLKRLAAISINKHTAELQFCMNEYTFKVCFPMSFQSAPLKFNLKIYRTQGIPEFLNATIQSSVRFRRFECYKCVRVLLDHLTAFTSYTVVMTNSGGGGESLKTITKFTTLQTVPEFPPLVDSFSFIRFEKTDDATCALMSALIIMWKPLPFSAIGSSNFSYYIEIDSENGFTFNTTLENTYIEVKSSYNPLDKHIAKIWAQNHLGQSINYTTLEIPSLSEEKYNLEKLLATKLMDVTEETEQNKCKTESQSKPKPYVVVEMKGDKLFVYVNNNFKIPANLAIHWCNNFTDEIVNGISICQEYFQTQYYTINSDGSDIQTFEITLNKPDVQQQNIIFNRTLYYYNLPFLNSSLNNLNAVNASVTISPVGVDLNQVISEDIYDYKIDHLKDIYYYEFDYYDNIVRKKRLTSPDTVPIKVFISLTREGSLWNSGMIPVNCYFDGTKDTDSLVVSQTENKNDLSVTLRWDQVCNTNTASHFMAKYFKVYTSTDEKCHENQNYMARVNNTIFQPKFMKLPKKLKFVCIQSCKSENICNTDFTTTKVKYPTEESVQQSNLYIILPVVSLFVLLCLIGFFVMKCRNSETKIKKVPKEEPNYPSSTKTSEHFRNEGYSSANYTEITIKHSKSITSEDSGRGTVHCDEERSSQKNQSDSSEFHYEENLEMGGSFGSARSERSDNESKGGNRSSGVNRGIVQECSSEGARNNREIVHQLDTKVSEKLSTDSGQGTEHCTNNLTENIIEFEDEEDTSKTEENNCTVTEHELDSKKHEKEKYRNTSEAKDYSCMAMRNKESFHEHRRKEKREMNDNSVSNERDAGDFSSDKGEIENDGNETHEECQTNQAKFLKSAGFKFNKKNRRISQTSDSTSEKFAESRFNDCIDNSNLHASINHIHFEGHNNHENNLQDNTMDNNRDSHFNSTHNVNGSLQRLFSSSESESEGDCEKSLLSSRQFKSF